MVRRRMVTITDGRSGRPTEVRSARHGLLRLCEHLALPGGAPGIDDMRVVVVGDVLLRVLERSGVQVALVWGLPDVPGAAEDPVPFRPVVAALGAHPPSDVVREAGVAAALGGAPDVRVGPPPGVDGGPGAWLRTGPATADPLPSAEPDGPDLLAVRLALLSLPYPDPAGLLPHSLEAADRELRQWRTLTAQWATSPSRPVPAEVREQAQAHLAHDLDTAAVLALMRGIATTDAMPDGAKFETFALLDGILGLELTRDLG